MLYRIRDPNIRRLALVKNPASGHRWHLFKSAPDDEEAALDALVNSLSPEEAAELLKACEVRPAVEERLDAIDAKLAKAAPAIRARRALAVLAKSAGTPEEQLGALVQHEEIRERSERILAEIRDRPRHGTSFLYNSPTATAEQTADYVMRLKAAGSRR